MKHDSIDRWRSQRHWQTNAIAINSWDYRQINTRPVAVTSNADNSSDTAELIAQDASGAYSYETRAQGQRLIDNQLLAIEAHNKFFTGAGTVRTLAPGTVFTLNGQSEHDQGSADDKSFLVLRVTHQGHNNLSADLQAQVKHCLGQLAQEEQNEEGSKDTHQTDFDSKHAIGNDKGERPLYRNRIEAIRASIPYKSLAQNLQDQHGQHLHPKPTVHGQQSAIVVGPEGTVVYTDRDHRIKVQFHWQRGTAQNQSHSRLAHRQTDGHSGAPGNEQAGTWVRVATNLAPIAGANWGNHTIPRIGQEVLIDFIEGDIDRPIVIGSLYNGKGNDNAQHNGSAQEKDKVERAKEKEAILNVKHFRLNRTGYPNRIKAKTFTEVCEAPNQFESVYASSSKFSGSETNTYFQMKKAECADLAEAIEAVREFISSGPKLEYLYDNFRGGKGARGKTIGLTRFWLSKEGGEFYAKEE